MNINDSLKVTITAKLKLFGWMLIAANTSSLAIYLCFIFLLKTDVDYGFCLGSFLIIRVYLFMANKGMPLTDENVAFMSSERILWNNATIAVAIVMSLAFLAAKMIF